MSKTTSLGLGSIEETRFLNHLTEHIKSNGQGILIKKSSQPGDFPSIDPVSVASVFKSKHKNYSRYSSDMLTSLVTRGYTKLKAQYDETRKASDPAPSPQSSQSASPSSMTSPQPAPAKKQRSNGFISGKPVTATGLVVKEKVKLATKTPPQYKQSQPKMVFNPKTPFDGSSDDSLDDSDANNQYIDIYDVHNDNINGAHPIDLSAVDTAPITIDDDMGDNDLFSEVNSSLSAQTLKHLNDIDSSSSSSSSSYMKQPVLTQDDMISLHNKTVQSNKNDMSSVDLSDSSRQTILKNTTNKSISSLYNANAIPYDQRPSTTAPSQQQNSQSGHNTSDPKQKLRSKDVRAAAMRDAPLDIQLKIKYRDLIKKGFSHDQAESIAREQLGMPTRDEDMAANGYSQAPIKRDKQGNIIPSNRNGMKNKPNTTTTPIVPIKSTVKLKDVGGIDGIIQDIREMIEYPILHPEIYGHLGVTPTHGVLLHGPPGCGKTLLAHAIAGELDIPLIKLGATEIVSKMTGEAENKIRQLFQDAIKQAPCIIFIDEIDAIAGKKEETDRDMNRRIVSQLMMSLDQLNDVSSINNTDNDTTTTTTTPDGFISPYDNETESERALRLNNDDDYMNTMLKEQKKNNTVIVIAATSRLDSIDPSLRRAGRFDREIALTIPDEKARTQILTKLTSKMTLGPDVDMVKLGQSTVGFVGADLVTLTREAATVAINRIFNDPSIWYTLQQQQQQSDDMGNITQATTSSSSSSNTTSNTTATNNNTSDALVTILSSPSFTLKTHDEISLMTASQKLAYDTAQRQYISHNLRQLGTLTPEQLSGMNIVQNDFILASRQIQPTAKREGFATLPSTTWNDVGSLDLLREELDFAIVQPILHPELFEQLGLQTPAGVLLFGPPGCGKTLVAKAVANASGASFLSVKGPELLNQYVGESERAVRTLFSRAAQCSPCVIFFDEIDALVPRRGGSGGNQASERVVNQLLTELDGFDDRRSVFVIAATNRPDIIDPAVLRPGRLDKLLYISLPDAPGRLDILLKHTIRTPIDVYSLPDDIYRQYSHHNTNNTKDNDDDTYKMAFCRSIAYDPRCEGFSGADMQALVRESVTIALKQYQKELFSTSNNPKSIFEQQSMGGLQKHKVNVLWKHFNLAFDKVRPSVSPKQRREYDQLCETISQGKAILKNDIHTVQDGTQSSTM